MYLRYFVKFDFPLHKDALCQVGLKLTHVALEQRTFKCRQCFFFCQFCCYLPLEKGGPFIWTYLNPLNPSMLCAKFDWNWLSDSRAEERHLVIWQKRRQGYKKDNEHNSIHKKITRFFGSRELMMIIMITCITYVIIFITVIMIYVFWL